MPKPGGSQSVEAWKILGITMHQATVKRRMWLTGSNKIMLFGREAADSETVHFCLQITSLRRKFPNQIVKQSES